MPPPRQENDPTRRVQILARIGFVWAACILARLIQLQIVDHDEYSRIALRQHEHEVQIYAPRGTITDSNGHPLAMSLPVDSVCVNPLRVPDPEVAADILSGVLKIDRNDLLDKIQRKKAGEEPRGFLWVKRRITPEESVRVRGLKLGWIEFRKESRRFYPKASLGAHLVGWVDHKEDGSAGVERKLNKDLKGHPGRKLVRADVRQASYGSEVYREAEPGWNVRLTIDQNVQYVAERELEAAVKKNRCKTGSLVMLNPETGDVLAMASYPTFDPNEPLTKDSDQSPRLNLALSAPFEPGSVFKVFSIAGVLEKTGITPDTPLSCGNGRLELFGRVIRDHHRYGVLPLSMVIAKSSNIGTINAVRRMAQEDLYRYVTAFGFGRRTGIAGLPAEHPGVVWNFDRWGITSFGSIAMGHEIMTTTVQLAQACAAIANGGFLIRPRMVSHKERGQIVEEAPPSERHRILQPKTALTIQQMMELVVLKGTGTAAKLDGYTAAGKTGSAQIYDDTTKHYTHKYNASFMGFAPVSKPSIVLVVTLNGASQFGGAVAAPVFKQVAMAALRLRNVRRDLPDELPEKEKEKNSDRNDPKLLADLASPGLVESGLIPTPPPLPEEEDQAPQVGPRVPDFIGQSLTAIMQLSASSGIPVEFAGKGIARAQEPLPGSVLTPGEKVRVQLSR